MADVENQDLEATPGGEVEMIEDAAPGAEKADGVIEIELSSPVEQLTFLDYLKSPMVEVHVDSGPGSTVLTAHQAFLTKVPYFEAECAKFADGASTRRIDLPDEDIDAVGSVLEYLYNSEYFPKRLDPNAKDTPLEVDPSIPSPDETGAGLLRHARIYSLADKLQIPALKSLAHSKIHNTASTARGEIAYARFVYKETSVADTQIRRPVAAFWATRSHKLRHQAEDEFRAMCLEFPQFGFDVLSLVLDQKEKGKGGLPRDDGEANVSGRGQSTPLTGRKRQRTSLAL